LVDGKVGNLKKAGEYLNQGIILNNNRIDIRWDIFNCKDIGNGSLSEEMKLDHINLLETKNEDTPKSSK